MTKTLSPLGRGLWYYRLMRVDYTGVRFGNMVCIEQAASTGDGARWLCRCDCGARETRRLSLLRLSIKSGNVPKCRACQRLQQKRRASGARPGRVRQSDDPAWIAWREMIRRCYRVRYKDYPAYGGRGIVVATNWRRFPAFIADMGPRPSPKHSIDRIDNDGNYEPGNCRWATQLEQQNNRRNNVTITRDGVSMTVSQWSRVLGIRVGTLFNRVYAGWSIERLFSPPRTRCRSHDRRGEGKGLGRVASLRPRARQRGP
jgi:hypothetical protein